MREEGGDKSRCGSKVKVFDETRRSAGQKEAVLASLLY